MNKSRYTRCKCLILVCLITIFSTSLAKILFIHMNYSKDFAQYQLMQDELEINMTRSSENQKCGSKNNSNSKKEAEKLTGGNEKLKSLKERNEDFLGWLSVEGTKINYPVMTSPYDPEFYLSRNFEKEYSFSGTPFTDSDITDQCRNLLIHGHNMKNGTMFSDLLKYEDEIFCREHPVIVFETAEQRDTYKIIAAFPVEITSESGKRKFHCYDYAGELSRERFEEYIENVKAEALYYIDENIQYGEQLLTLSTCSYHAKNGRFVVVAHRS